MKGPIERFDLTTENNDLGHARGVMESDPKGDYVSFEDHDRIVAELKAEVARQARVIEKLKRCILGFTEYFRAIKKGEVGSPREELRSFETVLLDSSVSLLKELEAVEQEADVEK